MRAGPLIVLLASALATWTCRDAGGDAAGMAHWTAERDRRIGDPEHPEQILGLVGPVVPLDDGRVWITHVSDATAYLYDERGRVEARFGRFGEGPPGFAGTGAMAWKGASRDTLWIEETYHGLVSLFTPEGRYVRSVPLEEIRYGAFRIRDPLALLDDGSAVAVADYWPEALEERSYRPEDPELGSFPVVRFDPERGEVTRELFRVDGIGIGLLAWSGGGTTMIDRFADHPIVASAPDGSRIVVVERRAPLRETEARVRVTALSSDGDTLWSRFYPYSPEPMLPEEADAVVRAQLEELRRFSALEGVDPKEAEEAYHRAVSPPAFRTPVTSARVALDGTVWIEWWAAQGEPRRWWILGEDGEPKAQWELEAGVEVRWVGADEVWGVARNPLGLSTVLRYRLRGRPS